MKPPPNTLGNAALASSPVAEIGRLAGEILTAAPPRPPPRKRPASSGAGQTDSSDIHPDEGAHWLSSQAGFDPSESFETARPVPVARSGRLLELHAEADRYFARWLETGDAADIQRAAELARQAHQLKGNP